MNNRSSFFKNVNYPSHIIDCGAIFVEHKSCIKRLVVNKRSKLLFFFLAKKINGKVSVYVHNLEPIIINCLITTRNNNNKTKMTPEHIITFSPVIFTLLSSCARIASKHRQIFFLSIKILFSFF